MATMSQLGISFVVDLLVNAHWSGLLLGYLAALMAISVSIEVRMRMPSIWRSWPYGIRAGVLASLSVLAIFFSSAFVVVSGLPKTESHFSLLSVFLVGFFSVLLCVGFDQLSKMFRAHRSVHRLVFPAAACLLMLTIHWGFIFSVCSWHVLEVSSPLLFQVVFVSYCAFLLLGSYVKALGPLVYSGLHNRMLFALGLLLINVWMAWGLVGSVAVLEKQKPSDTWWWLTHEQYEFFVSLAAIVVVLGLMTVAYGALDKMVKQLQAHNENLEEQKTTALAKALETNARLKREQDRTVQLEKSIQLAQMDHQVSVEGLVAAMSSLEDGMFEWDLEQDTLEFGTHWRRLFGLESLPKGPVPAPVWRHGILAEDQVQLNQAMQVCLTESASSHVVQLRYRNRYGALLKVELRIVAVRNAYGLPSKLVGVLHDRTHEMDLELSIREELYEESLISSRKSQFVDYLSHEIRTPMTIIGSAKALIENCMRKEVTDADIVLSYVDQIGLALKSLRGLVDETLMFMGTGYTKKAMQLNRLHVKKMLNDFLETQKRLHGIDQGFQVSVDARLDEVDFYSDEYSMSQALRQLLTFAQNRQHEVGRVVFGLDDNASGLRIELQLRTQPVWLQFQTQRIGVQQGKSVLAFNDESLPFSLLLTKRVIRFIGGRLMILQDGEATWLCVDLPSLREDACHES